MKKLFFSLIVLFAGYCICSQQNNSNFSASDKGTTAKENTDKEEHALENQEKERQGEADDNSPDNKIDGVLTDEDILKIEKSIRRPEMAKLKEMPIPLINWGLTYANVTRLQKQEGRSNFVWQNNLFGAFVELQSKNMKPVNSMLRLSIYYPLTHTFNDVSQKQSMLLYALDLFAGPLIEASMWDIVHLRFGLGIHYMYQLTDEFYFHYLGVGALVGMELPVAPRWTLVLDGSFTYDYPNLGSNSIIQPYNASWQYHIDFGVRYSRLGENPRPYIPKTPMQTALWNALEKQKDAKRREQDDARIERKIKYLEEHPEIVAADRRKKARKQALAEQKDAWYAEKLRIAEEKVAAEFAKEEQKIQLREKRKEEKAAAKAKANEEKEKRNEEKRLEKEESEPPKPGILRF